MSGFTRRNFIKTTFVATAAVNLAGFSAASLLTKDADAATDKEVKGRFKGGHHVGIYVNDMKQSVKFYEDMFGFKLLFIADVMEGDKPLQLGFIKLNNLYIELLKPVDVKGITPAAQGTANHICIRTDDAHAAYKALKEKGANFETPVLNAPMPFDREFVDNDIFVKKGKNMVNVNIFFMRGLNGERIEIMQDNMG